MRKRRIYKTNRTFIMIALMIALLVPTISPKEAHAASGTTYYISSSEGNDNNNGLSQAKPWKSLEKISTAAMQPGDKFLFKAGDVWAGSLKLKNIAGTAEAPIIFDKYGSTDPNSRPILNGNGTTTTEPFSLYTYYSGVSDKTQSAVIDITDGSYLEINNFEVTNYSETIISQRAGIAIKTSATNQAQWLANAHKGIVIKNNYVHDVNGNPKGHKMGSGGILLLGNISDALVENNKVINVDIEGIRNAGLYKEGDVTANFPKVLTNVQFINNYIEKVQGDGIVMSNIGTNGRIEYNTVVDHSFKNVGNVNYAGLWVIAVKDTVIQYNEVYGGKFGYNDGQAFDVDMFSEGTLYQYNYSHDNRGGFILFMGGSRNSLVRYNISVNDGNGAYLLHYLPTTANDAPLIHNNTFFADSNINTKIFSHTNRYAKLYNNIFMAKGTMNMGSNTFAGGEIKNNAFYPGSDIKGQSFSGVVLENSIFESPRFARPGEEPKNIISGLDAFNAAALDGYKLLSDSPLINAGADVSSLTPSVWAAASKDFFNNNISGAADIGAHEFSNDPPVIVKPEVLPTEIKLNQTATELYLGQSGAALTATVLPADAWLKGVKWSSSNPSVASVDASGKISAISVGTAAITAQSVVNASVKATSQVTVHPSTPVNKYIVASDDAYLSEDKKTVQLRIDGEMQGGGTVNNPPYYKVSYETDNPHAAVDPLTGKLTFTGDLAGVNEIGVTADIQEYKNLIYSESFENGWGDFVTEQNPPTSGSGGKLSDKVAYHGKYGVLYDNPPAVEKVFGPNQQGIVTMMLYDDGSKDGRTRVVSHVGNKRENLFAAMGIFFDGGTVGNLDNYSIRASSSATAWEKTSIPRTVGWHELKWDYTSGTDLKMYIDNQLVKTTTAIKSFDRISLAFVWDNASGRTFGFDNIKYASSDVKTTYKTERLKVSVDKPERLATTLTGPESIQSGKSFAIKYGLSGVEQKVYAQHIALNYDANLFEFVEAASLIDGVTIVDSEVGASGKLQFIIASLGAGQALTQDAEIALLTFKAKEVAETATGTISIASATLGDEQGAETTAELASLGIKVIAEEPGIPGDFNGDEKVSVGDLALIAVHYGKDTTSSDWQDVKRFDLNHDGKIDIVDLAAVAKLMIG
ncbi:cohesin domain-containing protein [Paenibacillus sp. FJAT-27812]|uniref:cohesin domain-containing protein n=1 Tax=Paenibacillus sp. FJAT-27812 TaxID=1684143 RepID=UPI0006A7733D|nr:cohesin domain-containing protein [Paenibacillus sp. FJAT-27812]